jgi:hypothetical protein
MIFRSCLLLVSASLAACSVGPPPCTLHEVQPVALLAIISSSGLPPDIAVPTIVLTIPALNGADELEPAATGETIALTLGDVAQTSATCDATPIAAVLGGTATDIRDAVNLITPTQKFSLSCTGTGAWAHAQITLRASGVTVPLHSATPFTLALDFEVDVAGAAVELSGTQAFGVVDMVVPGSC